jgi:hypothetical protein
MKTAITLLFLTVSFTLTAFGQDNFSLSQDLMGLSTGLQDNRAKVTISNAPGTELVGDYFYEKDWRTGSIFLKNEKTVADVRIKYHVQDDQLIFEEKGEKKLVDGKDVIAFSWQTPDGRREDFVNATVFVRYGVPVAKGFFRVWQEGKHHLLLSQREFWVKESDYYAALDAGRRFDQVKTRDHWYISKGQDVAVLQRSRKKSLQALEKLTGRADLAAWVKAEKISFKEPEDLRRFTEWLNQTAE